MKTETQAKTKESDMKTTYTITEKQSANSYREGTEVQAKTLAAAKALASKLQFFLGTVMEIKDISGFVLAIKENGKWRDIPRAEYGVETDE